MQITPGRVSVQRVYNVLDVEPVRDSARCPIAPEYVTVRFDNGRGGTAVWPTYIEVHGRRLRGERTVGTYSQGGFSITQSGIVLPDRRDNEAPPWVQEIVTLAVDEQQKPFSV